MQPVREVYSLLMPVQDGRIIVPRAAVAEVMGYSRPKERPEGAPEFLLGFVEWQGQRIPLVSFEAARGRGVPEKNRRARIAIVFGLAGRLDPNVFAVVTQGYPYLVRVNENVLHNEPMETADPLILARVRMANERPFVPDLEKLESLIADVLGVGEPTGEAPVEVDELDALDVADEEEFGSALLGETDDDENDAVGFDSDTNAPDNEAADVDIGDVTSFGTDTSVSVELDSIDDALVATVAEEVDESEIDLGEVTAVGLETDYAAELEELSSALDDSATDDSSDVEFTIDVSDETDGAKGDENEFDLSDLEFDLDEDAKDDSADDK